MVKNYRSLKLIDVPCSHLTAFVGANGTGKSTVLRAVNLFYGTAPQLTSEDWFNRNTKPDIEITLTFCSLSDEAKKRFAAYLQGETLSVTRRFAMNPNGKATDSYHGATLRYAAFTPLANLAAGPFKTEYNKLKEREPYKSGLPSYSNQDGAKAALKAWESKHPDECKLASDDGQFFGFKGVGQGFLGDFTCMIFVAAVRDLSDDAAEGRGSAIKDLIDIVARNVLAAYKDFRDLEIEMQDKYGKLIAPSQAKDLNDLSKERPCCMNLGLWR